MKHNLTKLAACTFASAMLGVSANSIAGGNLDTFNFTGEPLNETNNFVEVVPIFWDARCANVEYTLDTIKPNAAAGPDAEISIEATREALQSALDSWNAIPTSYINMNITQVRTIGNGTRSFDFINELTFETPPNFGALASSPSTSLQADAVFAPGDDIDGDGDSDVYDPEVAGINVCTDIDNDGDIEFPAGFYKAGTILDNDVQFGQGVNWSLEASDAPTADIEAIAVHELGHSHGLSHAAINVISKEDGNGSTMYPFIDTGDGAAELATRQLHDDDIAWSSFSYPEGSAETGIAALQEGDIAFDAEYSVLRGSLTFSNGTPIVGASMIAVSGNRDTRDSVESNTGKVRARQNLTSGGLFLLPPSLGIVNGDYAIPVKKGKYRVLAQALDGTPFESNRVSITGNIGLLYGLQDFPEEYFSRGRQESAIETDPGLGQFLSAVPGKDITGLDIVANRDRALSSYDVTEFIGTGAAIGFTDVVYATRFSNQEVMNLLNQRATLTSALIETFVFDASTVPKLQRVSLVTGTIDEFGNAQLNRDNPLRTETDLLAQATDDTPFYVNGARGVSRKISSQLSRNPELDLFVVVEIANDFETGPSGIPPLIAVDTDSPLGNSFLSRAEAADGAFLPFTSNFGIQLRFTGE